MTRKVLRIGILSHQEYMERTLAIAKGEYLPRPDEPKVWFESPKSLAEVLSNDNRKLLSIICRHQPESLKDLVQLSGRKSSNLSRTLRTMEKFGIVSLVKEHKHVRPIVNATTFQIELGLPSLG
jgi:predicted transcriptional regulator